jgi:hypothetical protein
MLIGGRNPGKSKRSLSENLGRMWRASARVFRAKQNCSGLWNIFFLHYLLEEKNTGQKFISLYYELWTALRYYAVIAYVITYSINIYG